MKARRLVAAAVYDPTTLRAIGKAFDDAWEQISPQVSARSDAIEAARLKLAEIVLSLTKDGTRDPGKLTEAAMRLMLAGKTKL